MNTPTQPARSKGEAKHTPGEWKLSQVLPGDTFERIETDRQQIAHVFQVYEHGRRQDSTTKANARLIAQAPSLLQALEACLACLTMDSDSEEDYAKEIKQARAIIARAKGEA